MDINPFITSIIFDRKNKIKIDGTGIICWVAVGIIYLNNDIFDYTLGTNCVKQWRNSHQQ
jgi:hypothetical protein